mmetsp:Transcript_14430/g.31073  ORF Transcript_14430/g.31073 Transcript_14430/m.31073 type:complete len:101 (-) Transcript_14430:262-564(-)
MSSNCVNIFIKKKLRSLSVLTAIFAQYLQHSSASKREHLESIREPDCRVARTSSGERGAAEMKMWDKIRILGCRLLDQVLGRSEPSEPFDSEKYIDSIHQ